MPEVYPVHVPAPRCVIGWDGTAYRAFTVDATGHLQVDALSSVLPTGAATAANQALILAQVQLIEDLRNALQSVATDRLQVRGENQLFSFKGALQVYFGGAVSGADGYADSPVVPAGEVWVVTTIAARDVTRTLTGVEMTNYHVGYDYRVHHLVQTIPVDVSVCWGGHTYLGVDDFVRVYYEGSLAGDIVVVHLTGYRMTVEA